MANGKFSVDKTNLILLLTIANTVLLVVLFGYALFAELEARNVWATLIKNQNILNSNVINLNQFGIDQNKKAIQQNDEIIDRLRHLESLQK